MKIRFNWHTNRCPLTLLPRHVSHDTHSHMAEINFASAISRYIHEQRKKQKSYISYHHHIIANGNGLHDCHKDHRSEIVTAAVTQLLSATSMHGLILNLAVGGN